MNNIIIMGRLTADPEIRQTNSGKTVASFTVAVDRKQKEKATDFFRCVAFEKTADNIERFFNKGSRILLRGSMQSDTYEKDGKKQTSWSLIVNEFDFVDGRDAQPAPAQKSEDIVVSNDDDDFPF